MLWLVSESWRADGLDTEVMPAVVDRMTSHLDLLATLLPLLGVHNDPRDLSLGVDLCGPDARGYSLIGDLRWFLRAEL